MIDELVSSLNSMQPSDMYKEIIVRLEGFGYSVDEKDLDLIVFSLKKVISSFRLKYHLSVIPEEIKCFVVDRTCGEILVVKMFASGGTGGGSDDGDGDAVARDGILTSQPIQSISMGGASITYVSPDKSGDSSVSFSPKETIDELLNAGADELKCLRSIKW